MEEESVNRDMAARSTEVTAGEQEPIVSILIHPVAGGASKERERHEAPPL
jgi:hypothetical protein